MNRCPVCHELLVLDAPDKGRTQWQERCVWGHYSRPLEYAQTFKGDTITQLEQVVAERMP